MARGKFSALLNVCVGCATAGAMTACGMPTPILWGVLAAVLNFIPYAGPATTLVVLTLVAFVTFDGLGQVIAVAGSYLILATITGQFVQPLLVGRRLKVNPLLVFLALWFGGLFWGVAGIVLATPALLAREAEFRERLQQAFALTKPTFNEEMRGGHTNM